VTNNDVDSDLNLDLFRRMTSSGMLRRVALVRTDVSGELSASFIRVRRIGELGTTLVETSNRHCPLTTGTSPFCWVHLRRFNLKTEAEHRFRDAVLNKRQDDG
jgi:hypothetical protein